MFTYLLTAVVTVYTYSTITAALMTRVAFSVSVITTNTGNSSVVERRTRDRKVSGSSPGLCDGSIFSPGSAFCADSYFGIRSTSVLLS